jgi:hypothetical protein
MILRWGLTFSTSGYTLFHLDFAHDANARRRRWLFACFDTSVGFN